MTKSLTVGLHCQSLSLPSLLTVRTWAMAPCRARGRRPICSLGGSRPHRGRPLAPLLLSSPFPPAFSWIGAASGSRAVALKPKSSPTNRRLPELPRHEPTPHPPRPLRPRNRAGGSQDHDRIPDTAAPRRAPPPEIRRHRPSPSSRLPRHSARGEHLFPLRVFPSTSPSPAVDPLAVPAVARAGRGI